MCGVTFSGHPEDDDKRVPREKYVKLKTAEEGHSTPKAAVVDVST